MESSQLSKNYYKIKDVSDILGVPQTTLRFWEREFPEIDPRRSAHNQRYYTIKDIETLRIVKYLVKDRGLKIESAKALLHNNRKNISKKLEIIDKLTGVRNELEILLRSLEKRGGNSQT